MNESTDLVVRPNNEALMVVGTEDLGREDLVIPRVRLVQPTSALGGNAGELFNALTGESAPEIHAVILRIGKSRVLWPSEYQRDQRPLCASNDGIVPRTEFAGMYAEQCADCPQMLWGDNGEPPACSFGYSYLAADRSRDDLPFILTANRSSLKAARACNTLVKAFGQRREVVIAAQQAVSDRGKYYVLTFKLGEPIPSEDVIRYVAMARALGGITLGPDVGEENGSQAKEDAAPDF